MRKPFPLALTLLVAVSAQATLFFAAKASAQDQTPGFQLPQIITPDEVSDLSVDFDQSFNAIPNAYLSDSMKLNYQISLLEKMVERQSALEKVGESFGKLGIAFEPPAPSRGICEQLPANAPCLKAYPELYGDLVAGRKAYYAELEAQAAAAGMGSNTGTQQAAESPEAKAKREKEESERKEREARKEREGRYRWSNVSCVIGQCHGVLVKANNDGYRATVRKGTRLPDNTLVQDVSASGIRVSIDGDSIALRPVAAEATAAPTSGAENISNQIEQAGVLTPTGLQKENTAASTPSVQAASATAPKVSAPAPSAAAANASGTPSGQTSVEPALGPSGLF